LRGAITGHVFALGALVRLRLVGAIAWGRPTNYYLSDGYTLQGYRLATADHVHNLGSMMIGRSAKIAKLLGYRRLVAYCREDYPGTQLRAAGFAADPDRVIARSGEILRRYYLHLDTGAPSAGNYRPNPP